MSSTLLAVYIGLICAAVIVLLILLIVYLVRRWRADKNTRGLENYICVNGRVYRIVLSDEEYIAMPETARQAPASPAPAANVVINNVVPAQPAAESVPSETPATDAQSAATEQSAEQPVAEQQQETKPEPVVETQPVAEKPANVARSTTINIINAAPSEGNAKAEEAPKVVSETTPAPAPSDASVPRVAIVKTKNTVKTAEASEKKAEGGADAELDEIIKIVPREAERDAEKEHAALSDGASIFASAYKNLSDEKKKFVDEIIGYAVAMDPNAVTRDFKHYRSVYLGDVPIIHVYIVKGIVRTRVPSENVEEMKVSSGGIMRSVAIPVGGVVENEQQVAENLHHIELAYSMIRGGGLVNAEGKPSDAGVEELIEIVPHVAEEDAEKEHASLSDGASIFASAYKNLSDEKKKYVDEIINYALSIDSKAETRDFKHYRSVYLGYMPIIHVYIVKGVVRTRLPSESVNEIKVSARGVKRMITRPVGGVVENEQNVAENMEHIDLAYSMIRNAKVYTVEHHDGLVVGIDEDPKKE